MKLQINKSHKEIMEDENRWLISYGGAGSSKSYSTAQKILIRILSEENHRFLITRKVAKTLRVSVFQLFKDIISDLGIYEQFKINKSDMTITNTRNNSQLLFFGLDDIEKLKSIQGITSIWIEEASETIKGDILELNRRLRGHTPYYKQIILTFNPISHLHWLKEHFFDNAMSTASIYKTTYLDNHFIDDEYKKELEDIKHYDIQQYNIYALGEWGVLNTNIIYHKYNFKTHRTDMRWYDFEVLHIGIDFNVGGCACVVCGEIGEKVYVVDYLAPYDTQDMAIELDMYRENKQVILYPDASGDSRNSNGSLSDIRILRDEGYTVNVPAGNGAVKDRINSCNKKFSMDEIFVNERLDKVSLALQTQTYQDNGDPEKSNEHKGGSNDDTCFSGDTEIIVNNKKIKFRDVPKEGLIRGYEGKNIRFFNGGLKGYDRILEIKLNNGIIIKCTDDHEILTLDGWVQAKYIEGKVICNTELYRKMYNHTKEENTIKEQMVIFIKLLEVFKRKKLGKVESQYIEPYGLKKKGIFLKDLLFTIKMKINLIIILTTLILWKGHFIILCTLKNGTVKTKDTLKEILKKVKINAESGINQKKAESGTKNIMKSFLANCIRKSKLFVRYVEKKQKLLKVKVRETNIVQESVHHKREEIAESIIQRNNVHPAESNFLQTNMLLENTVKEVVRYDKQNVYCVSTEEGCFSLANNTIVSNCDALGYYIVRRFGLVRNVMTQLNEKWN